MGLEFKGEIWGRDINVGVIRGNRYRKKRGPVIKS